MILHSFGYPREWDNSHLVQSDFVSGGIRSIKWIFNLVKTNTLKHISPLISCSYVTHSFWKVLRILAIDCMLRTLRSLPPTLPRPPNFKCIRSPSPITQTCPRISPGYPRAPKSPELGSFPFLCISRLAFCFSVSKTSWPIPQHRTLGLRLRPALLLPLVGQYLRASLHQGQPSPDLALPPFLLSLCSFRRMSPPDDRSSAITGLLASHSVLFQLKSKTLRAICRPPSPAMGVPRSSLFLLANQSNAAHRGGTCGSET